MEKQELSLLTEGRKIFNNEANLIELPSYGRAVFVGDTHGDFDATRRVIDRYMKDDSVVVFLGDYVDRGRYSRENIDFLLESKIENPENLFLLMGNHEAHKEFNFQPANFWESLPGEERGLYEETLIRLPLAASGNSLIALHGALPDLQEIRDINKIKPKEADYRWETIIWGDFRNESGKELGTYNGRPQFGRDYFKDVMGRFKKKVLIRSHDPHAEEIMYGKRCLTIFTSHAYLPRRTVAVADLERGIKTTDDLKIEEI